MLTAITPSSDRFSLFIFARTCSKLYCSYIVSTVYCLGAAMIGGGWWKGERTIPMSLRRSSRCCSKKDFSPVGADPVAGALVEVDIFGG